jgi:pimeloyl-ACP methyl ester carboxylesterase
MTSTNTTSADPRTGPQKPPQNYYGRSLQAAFAVAQLVPPLALRLAYRLFYVPRKSHRPPFAPPGFEKTFVRAGDYSICVYAIGEGKPVLLIHGWELGVYRFEALMREIAKAGFRVVAFDIPGHGESTGKQSDIVEICKVACELDKSFGPFFAGVAHSYGGLCLANLLRIGLKMQKVVLLATPAAYESIIDRFGEFLHLRPRVMASLRDAINRRYAPHRLEEDFNALKNLRKTKTPALLVHDETDPVVPFADASALAQAHADVRIVSTNGLGHNRIVSSPEVISSYVEFLTAERRSPEVIGGDAR